MKSAIARRQRGAVLVIALLFLTILTMLAVTAMTATTFEEKMAGNTRDVALAFQAAEAALRDGRRDINRITILAGVPRTPSIAGKTGFGDGSDQDNGTCGTSTVAPQTLGLCRPFPYDAGRGIQPILNTTASLENSPSVEYGTFTGAPMPATLYSRRPRYIIEVLCLPRYGASLGDESFCNFYRITARGYGGNPNTQVTVQEIFLRP